jgi:AcrR family transcriptional regulator
VSRRILAAPSGSVKETAGQPELDGPVAIPTRSRPGRAAWPKPSLGEIPTADDGASTLLDTTDDAGWPSAAAAAGDATGSARRTRRREARRDAILRAAAPLFVRKGFTATSLDDVAGALGLTRPAIYHYFPDKHRILLEIVERGFANLSQEARGIARGPGSAMAKLERIFHLHLSRVAADPQAIFLVSVEAGDLSAPVRAALGRRRQRYERLLAGLFEEAMAEGDLARSNPRLLVKAMVSLCNWVYAWYDPRGLYRPQDVARFFWELFASGAAADRLSVVAAELDENARPRRRSVPRGAA